MSSLLLQWNLFLYFYFYIRFMSMFVFMNFIYEYIPVNKHKQQYYSVCWTLQVKT